MIDYLIKHTDAMLFWSWYDGWVDYKDATRFTEAEQTQFTPPLNGMWTADVTKLLEDNDA
jgi:hypothetical protein